MATEPDTIVLIHGLWMTPLAWEHWVERYEDALEHSQLEVLAGGQSRFRPSFARQPGLEAWALRY